MTDVTITDAGERKLIRLGVTEVVSCVTAIGACFAMWYGTQNAIAEAKSDTKTESETRQRADAEQQRETERIRADTDARLGRMERTLERIEAKIDTKADRDEAMQRKRAP